MTYWKILLTIIMQLRACLHGGGGLQVGKVTRLGELSRLSTCI